MRTKKSLKVLVLALAVVMVFGVCSTALALYTGSWSSFSQRSTANAGQSLHTTRLIQRVLYVRGHFDLQTDGQYGGNTAGAIRTFQSAKNLYPVDGITGPTTWNALYNNTYGQGIVGDYNYRGGLDWNNNPSGVTVAGQGTRSGYWYWVSAASEVYIMEN